MNLRAFMIGIDHRLLKLEARIKALEAANYKPPEPAPVAEPEPVKRGPGRPKKTETGQ